jgi:hypothetical protein
MQVEDWFDMEACYEACLANLNADIVELNDATQDDFLKQHVLDIMLPEYLYSLIPVGNNQRIVNVIQSVTRVRQQVFDLLLELTQSSRHLSNEHLLIGHMRRVNEILHNGGNEPLQSTKLILLLKSTCRFDIHESERHLLIPWCLRLRNDLVDALLYEQHSVGKMGLKPWLVPQCRQGVSVEHLTDMTNAADLMMTNMFWPKGR